MDYEGFKNEIIKIAGINLNNYKEKQMKRRIDTFIQKNSIDSYEDFVGVIKNDGNKLNEFLKYLTINVSEFYRNADQWDILEKDIFPMLLEKSDDLKIWSAACSTGEEPYTLVMVLNKFLPLEKIHINATDIDIHAIEDAKKGKYNERAIQKLPSEYLDNHFEQSGDTYSVKNRIKERVRFTRHDLLKDRYISNCDLIVCRNVLIYFTEEAKTGIYENFNRALRKGGVLFIGSSEQIIVPSRFSLKTVRTFFYIKQDEI
jgi:chemotaxis protein methyltransferase CheR